MTNWAATSKDPAECSDPTVPFGETAIASERAKGHSRPRWSIARAIRKIVNEVRGRLGEKSRKRRIVDGMYAAEIRKLALERGLCPRSTSVHVTIEDCKKKIVSRLTLDDLLDIAGNRRILLRDIVKEAKSESSSLVALDSHRGQAADDAFRRVLNSVQEFEPTRDSRLESMYRTELFQWLKSRFPDTRISSQRSLAWPDIVTDGVAIEVEAHPTKKRLRAIEEKCMKYLPCFRNGIVIALFDVRVGSCLLQEWSARIRKAHEHSAHLEVLTK